VDTSTGPVELSWTHLVYAVGSVAAAPIPGAREHGLLLGTWRGLRPPSQRSARPVPARASSWSVAAPPGSRLPASSPSSTPRPR
jgi:hypothetical protein